MRRKPGVLPRQDASLGGHERPQQGDILKIKRVAREVDFGFGARRARFTIGRPSAGTAFVWFVGASFAWHRSWLFDFAVEGVPAQRRVVFLELQLFRLELLVPRRGEIGRAHV